MRIEMSEIFEVFERNIKKQFFNEFGVFKYLEAGNEIIFNESLFYEEHKNVSFNKKTACIGDFRFYSFNSNDYLGGGILIINKVTGQTAIAFSVALSSNHYHSIVTSISFENFKEVFLRKNEAFQILGANHYSNLKNNVEVMTIASQFDYMNIYNGKNNSKLLNICFSAVHELSGFNKDFEKIKASLLNYEPKNKAGRNSYYLTTFFTDPEKLPMNVFNKILVEEIMSFKKENLVEFFDLDLKFVIESMIPIAEEILRPKFKVFAEENTDSYLDSWLKHFK